MTQHVSVAVIGGSQAGLSMSHDLSANGIDHVVFEKNKTAHSWRTQRWDSFCLVTPNWQCKLPDYDYPGNDPDGFMVRDDIVAYVEDYARHIKAPLKENTGVTLVTRTGSGFYLETGDGPYTADAVVLAVGGYHQPNIPRLAERLPASIQQLHSSTYRNSAQLPPGEVLVVGSGQSGCQIAEDLHLDGRKTHLVVGSAPRCPRGYRGKDAVDWLADLGQYDLPVDQHPMREKVRKKANHYLTGRDGGRDIDLRKFAQEGMRLYGRLTDYADGSLRFADDLEKNLDGADASYNNICAMIDKYIADNAITAPDGHRTTPVWRPESPQTELDPVAQGITSIIWSTGFRADWSWIDLPIFDGNGYPSHKRGVTSMPGVYVLGLPWLYTWGSGRFVGVGRDAGFLADQIVEHLAVRPQVRTLAEAETRPTSCGMNKTVPLALALLLPPLTAHAADPWAGAEKMTVLMVDNRFEPDHLTFHAGRAYDLRLENHGTDMHEFTAPAFLKAATIKDKRLLANGGSDIVVQPGKSTDILLIAPPKGHYDLTCADHDWDGMVGSITVD